MAKIVEHGKYWKEDISIADTHILDAVLIKCPECYKEFLVYKYDCFVEGKEAWCDCGCRFIPEDSDLVTGVLYD